MDRARVVHQRRCDDETGGGEDRHRALAATHPGRYIYTEQELTVSSVFQETKGIVLSAYFGGLVFAETAAGSKKYKAEISSVPKGDERALCVDWIDYMSTTQVYHHRLYVPPRRGLRNQDPQWSRTQEARWGLTFAALDPIRGSTALAVWLTDDPAVLLASPNGAAVVDGAA